MYLSKLNNWDLFLKQYPNYLSDSNKTLQTKIYENELDENDLIQDMNTKMMLNVTYDRDMDAPITKAFLATVDELNLFSDDLNDFRFLKYMTKLEKLDIGGNHNFTQNDLEFLTNMTSLKTLKIRGNAKINDVTVLKDLPIEELWLDESGVGSLYQLQDFKHLKKLHAALLGAHDHAPGEEHDHSNTKNPRHDELAKINENVLSKLTHLEELDITGSSLNSLEFMKSMPNLKRLYVDGTYLSKLNKIKSEKLEILSASGNELDFVEIEAPLLKELNFNHNLIQNVRLNTPNLTALKLANNKLSSIDFTLPKLEKLYLQNNQFESIDFNENYSNLTTLYLQNNKITDISSISKLENLSIFDASRNSIKNINALGNLSHLKKVILSQNQIDDLITIEKLFSLSNITLSLDFQMINPEDSFYTNQLLQFYNQKDESIDINSIQDKNGIKFKYIKNSYSHSYGGIILK